MKGMICLTLSTDTGYPLIIYTEDAKSSASMTTHISGA